MRSLLQYLYINLHSVCLQQLFSCSQTTTLSKWGSKRILLTQGRSRLYFSRCMINRFFPIYQNRNRTLHLLQIDKREKFTWVWRCFDKFLSLRDERWTRSPLAALIIVNHLKQAHRSDYKIALLPDTNSSEYLFFSYFVLLTLVVNKKNRNNIYKLFTFINT